MVSGRLTKESDSSSLTEGKTYGISLFDAMKPDKPRQKKKHSQLKIG